MTRICSITFVCLFSMVCPCCAGVCKQPNGPATLEVCYDGDAPKLALADLILVKLTIEGSSALNVFGAPLDLPPNAKWTLFERSGAQRSTIGPDRVRWQLTYRFGPRDRGKDVPFAFPDVKFRDGENQIATWTPISFEVTSQIEVPDPSKVKGSAATIEELPAIETSAESPWHWWLLALILPAAGLTILGLRRLLRRREIRTPEQIALYEWQRLIAMKLPDKGRSERFVTLLTLLVRQYLERRFALPARRQTTPEFLRTLESCPDLSAEEKHVLTTLLQSCEAFKFAPEAMSVTECNRWAEATRAFLQARMSAAAAA